MKEKIYTIPVNEAFSIDCECQICELEKRFENECVDYVLGPSLMDSEKRIQTNDKGFCTRHFELLYNKQANRLGLGLILDTYMLEQLSRISKIVGHTQISDNSQSGLKSFLNSFSGNGISSKDGCKSADKLLKYIEEHEKKCDICDKLDYTMDRYIDVILEIYFTENDFRKKFDECNGFCMPHLKMLILGAKKYLNQSKSAEFCNKLIEIQLNNLSRIEKEVKWFTQKFDYRNTDAPWGNSKDAIARGIVKMSGAKNLNK